jgi:hypothetical protein
MFNYLYWPYDWGAEVASQLARVQSHAQIILGIAELEKMEAEIFKLQNRGIHVELIVFLEYIKANGHCRVKYRTGIYFRIQSISGMLCDT